MENKRILVVDDEPDMRIFVSTVLETNGYQPVAAENGGQALQKARSQPPALVILDVMMPRIEDGIRAYREFRSDKDLAGIPILMLSAIARKTFFHSIRMLNPDKRQPFPEPEGYMEKPPDAADLLRLVESALGKGRNITPKG